MVDGEPIGDPLDVKMFEFTKWTLEEGTVAGTGIIKDRAAGDRPAALVQTVVRPPGGGTFRVEDALRGNERVSRILEAEVMPSAHDVFPENPFPGTWRYPNIRICFSPAENERRRQAAEE
jgi:hypothetical protein